MNDVNVSTCCPATHQQTKLLLTITCKPRGNVVTGTVASCNMQNRCGKANTIACLLTKQITTGRAKK